MILKLRPSFVDKPWGGHKLQDIYKYDSSDTCGEAWGISAYGQTSSIVENGPYKGKTLVDLFVENKQLFGNMKFEQFPLLVKLIDANDTLSIQVHPNDLQAKKLNSFGKEECWYVLDADEDSFIYIGHNAKTKKEFAAHLADNSVEEILNKVKVKKGDFFYIKPGTVHAIGKGILILEVQQSSDITYRLYDFNRTYDGKHRTLHIEDGLKVLQVPGNTILRSSATASFFPEILSVDYEQSFIADQHGDYIFIVDGKGMFNDTPVQKGDFIMVTSFDSYQVVGKLTFQRTRI
jgi:mannose-6-phosphate isomerase